MAGIRFSCDSCSQHFEAPAEAAGCEVSCPGCGAELRVPLTTAAETPTAPTPGSPANACPFCQTAIAPTDPATECPSCRARYHADCWTENGGCGVYGCQAAPEIDPRRAIEIPISYWGQEHKPCPRCGQSILAAAVRCRFCGATFSSARPEDSAEYEERALVQEQAPALKRMVVILFVLSVIPCLAPVGAIWGAIWYPLNRRKLKSLPSIFPALSVIGLFVAFAQCLLWLLLATLFSATRDSLPNPEH